MNVSRFAGRAAGALCAAAAGLAVSTAQAQDIRLYAFSSGALTLGKGILHNLAPMEPPITVPVGFFVVRHPKGNVLFDTGNNDKLINDPSYWASPQAMKPAMTPDVAIDAQLKKIGLVPDDIDYVVCSHLHLDHGGNVGKFPNSTIVVQKDEVRERVLARARHRRSVHPRRLLPLRKTSDDSANESEDAAARG